MDVGLVALQLDKDQNADDKMLWQTTATRQSF
jgi:hypothetical protein